MILFIFLTLLFFDIFDIPNQMGLGYIHFDWVSIACSICLGALTLYFTITISLAQRRMEADKISSEKFFKVSFIERFQRIELGDERRNLKLKIKEFDNNLIKTIKIADDVRITRVGNGKLDLSDRHILKVSHESYEMEHTDAGMDKEWKENKEGFCYVRFGIENDFDLNLLKDGQTYVFELKIIATNIFGVQVECRLSPWFKVHEHPNDISVAMKATHNFGYYDSVKYVGSCATLG